MSNRDDNNSNYNVARDSYESQVFSFSNTKNRNSNVNLGKNSSSKKKAKPTKMYFDPKQLENNDRAQIKTPQSHASKIKKGVTVNIFIINN
jgi:hypothetical protein